MIRICPRCGKEYIEYSALSRKDNKTEICPRCGTKEALEALSVLNPSFYDNIMRKLESA